MEATKTIRTIKLTGDIAAVTTGVSAVAVRLRSDVVLASGVLCLGGSGESRTGLFGGRTPVDVERPERSDRPTQAPKAVAAAARYGCAPAVGAGNQQDHRIHQAQAAFATNAKHSMWALRGLPPWRERT